MDMEKLLQEAMKLQQDLSVAQETIDKKEYEASMGGGALHVCVKGNMEVSRIEISDELMDTENKEDLQDMLIVCLNQALQQKKKKKDQKMQSMTSGISIPGVF